MPSWDVSQTGSIIGRRDQKIHNPKRAHQPPLALPAATASVHLSGGHSLTKSPQPRPRVCLDRTNILHRAPPQWGQHLATGPLHIHSASESAISAGAFCKTHYPRHPLPYRRNRHTLLVHILSLRRTLLCLSKDNRNNESGAHACPGYTA